MTEVRAAVQAPPKVTPWLLRRADDLCARRLARDVEGAQRSHDPVHRSRLRDAFLGAARDAHAELRAPTEADWASAGRDLEPELEPEERAVLAQCAHWYVHLFGDRAAGYADHGLDSPTFLPRDHLRVGGWVDLAVVAADGTRELRQLDLWGGRGPTGGDPMELAAVRLAVLRLRAWVGADPLRVVWADLLRGVASERWVDLAAEHRELRAWFDARVAVVRARSAEARPTAGADCAGCAFVAACPEHPGGAHYGRRGDVLPGIVGLTPTGVSRWHRCRREWRDVHVLSVPGSDLDLGPAHGAKMHALLHLVHERGSCRDTALVDDVLAGHAAAEDLRVRAELDRHVRRCPEGARAIGHEVTMARFGRDSRHPFMATARIDALWAYDDVLDAHDYKTGRVSTERVADDAQAQLQAFVLAPLAAREGRRIRITFEHLAPDVLEDPEPFEPDDDDLAAIAAGLHDLVATIRATTEWTGVADAEICGRCRYRSICPDSAAPGVPQWPRVDADEDWRGDGDEDADGPG